MLKKRKKKMGNIVAGFLTGIFIYISDMVLKQFIISGGVMEFLKFALQGWLTYIFVQRLESLSSPK